MSANFDLHIHSDVSSDATHPVDEIFKMVLNAGIQYFAITDHNDTIGSFELAMNFCGDDQVYLIPALELSTWLHGIEVHVLAYGVNYFSTALKECLRLQGERCEKQAILRCEALQKLGFKIDFDELVKNSRRKIITTVSIFEELKRHSDNDKLLYDYVHGDKKGSAYMNFYSDYTALGGKAYVDYSLLDFNYVVDLLQDEALLSIAHPMVYDKDFLEKLTVNGITGFEIYSTYKMKEPLQFYKDYIDSNNLIATAGSDYHGESMKPGIKIGDISANEAVLDIFLEKLHKLSNEPLIELRVKDV